MLEQEDRFVPSPNYLKRVQSSSVLHQQRRTDVLAAVYDVSSRAREYIGAASASSYIYLARRYICSR